GAAAAGVLATAVPAAAEEFPAGFTRPVRTPEEALQALREGNARFARGGVTEPNRNLARVREVAPKQTPFASILGCADSRVPVELVFDQGFGDLFVCRAAGNIVTPEILGSLEFGTLVLGSRALVVLGHSACGAVKATIAGDPVPGQISALYQHIQPAVDAAGPDLDAAIAENVRIQARLLSRASPVIAGLVKEGKLKVVGGVYDLASGRVTFLEG
ncbi:MAG TPA: carbonic anhydrase, partial [Longimicrobiaceae bacterium]|nr:carbonic anhydrase [Longimicrobiaceae bacterium]